MVVEVYTSNSSTQRLEKEEVNYMIKPIEALATYLEVEQSEIEANDYGTYEVNGEEYMVLTDDEADEKAKEDIDQMVWAFNADFIIEHSKALDYDDASKQIIKAIQEQYESGNDAMKKLIDDFDEFVEDAISADGRGHFLNTYDGEENEITVGGTTYFIYRIN